MTEAELMAIDAHAATHTGEHEPECSCNRYRALVAEVRRLRGLMKRVEWERQGDPHWTSCPWGCVVKTNWDADTNDDDQPIGAHGYFHDDDCPAFTPDGDVR